MSDLRKLKDDALDAAAKGNWRKASWCYANLEKDDPSEPSWALKLGESLRRLGNKAEAINALARAMNAYATDGLTLKAVAVCKIILGLDPDQSRAKELLDTFSAAQRQGANPAALANKVAEPATTARAVPVQGPPLRQLRLAALVPGARPSAQVPSVGSSAAMEIPVDSEFTASDSRAHKAAGRATMARFVLPKTALFPVLTRAQLQMLVERVQLVPLAAGEILFSQGDSGDALYVVAWGEVAVGADRELARLGEGELFGEIALLADRPRTATVRATVDSHVLSIDRALLNDLIAGSPDVLTILLRFLRERLVVTLAETSPLFAPFPPLERLGLAARFQFIEIDEGLRMVEQGERSPGLFLLLSGEAEAMADGTSIARFESGEVFGEISLITGQPATASVETRSKSFVLFLPRSDFSEIIMTHPQMLEQLSSIADARLQEIGRIDIL